MRAGCIKLVLCATLMFPAAVGACSATASASFSGQPSGDTHVVGYRSKPLFRVDRDGRLWRGSFVDPRWRLVRDLGRLPGASPGNVSNIASLDGRWLLAATRTNHHLGLTRYWLVGLQAGDARLLAVPGIPILAKAFSPDGRTLAMYFDTGDAREGLYFVDTNSARVSRTQGPRTPGRVEFADRLGWSANGKNLYLLLSASDLRPVPAYRFNVDRRNYRALFVHQPKPFGPTQILEGGKPVHLLDSVAPSDLAQDSIMSATGRFSAAIGRNATLRVRASDGTIVQADQGTVRRCSTDLELHGWVGDSLLVYSLGGRVTAYDPVRRLAWELPPFEYASFFW